MLCLSLFLQLPLPMKLQLPHPMHQPMFAAARCSSTPIIPHTTMLQDIDVPEEVEKLLAKIHRLWSKVCCSVAMLPCRHPLYGYSVPVPVRVMLCSLSSAARQCVLR